MQCVKLYAFALGTITIIIVIVVFLIVVTGNSVSYAAENTDARSGAASGTTPIVPSAPAPKIDTRPSQPSEGSPAIHFRSNLNADNPNAPTFTTDDITQFVTAQRTFGRRITATTAPTVAKIEFITNHEVNARLGRDGSNEPDTRPLCYVTLKGTFTFIGLHGQTKTSTSAFAVLDARTGNLIYTGTSEN